MDVERQVKVNEALDELEAAVANARKVLGREVGEAVARAAAKNRQSPHIRR